MAQALLFLDITPKTPADRQKLARALQVLAAEDNQLDVCAAAESDCTVIGANSEAHLERTVDRLKREFEVAASVGRPAVAYLETVTRSAEGSAKHVRMIPGEREYAHVSLRLHPAGAGAGYSFTDATTGEVIPKHFMKSIDTGIRESMAHGVLRGYPIVDVRVEVHDGSYHDIDSTDAAFRTAAALALEEAAKKAQPLLLEPVMQVVARADNRYINTVLDRLLMRRGEILARTPEPGQEVITARVPLSKLFGFEGQLRAETHGHASCSIQFAYYQPAVDGPGDDDDRISRVGAPRRPAPHLRSSTASLPEPDDEDTDA
jgi:elongation factor G